MWPLKIAHRSKLLHLKCFTQQEGVVYILMMQQQRFQFQTNSATHLFLSGHLASDQQPEETLGQRLLTPWSFRQQLLALWDTVTPETDSLWIHTQGREAQMNTDLFKTCMQPIGSVAATCQFGLFTILIPWVACRHNAKTGVLILVLKPDNFLVRKPSSPVSTKQTHLFMGMFVRVPSTDLIRIQHWGLVHQTLHSPHASVDLCTRRTAY